MAGRQGAKGVYIDEVLNVIYPVGVTENDPLAVYMAHSDVVFPDTDPLPLKMEDGRLTRLAEMSKAYGTEITIENGIGIVRLEK